MEVFGGLLKALRIRGFRRPWEILIAGDDSSAIDAETRRALTKILDFSPSIGALTVQTSRGAVRISRHFRDTTTDDVDNSIAGIFARNEQVIAIEFPGHTATAEDPHMTSWGKVLDQIALNAKSGEFSERQTADRALFKKNEVDHDKR